MTNTDASKQESTSALESAYREVCESYRAIDDFRMKLLGILPIVSVAGLFALDAAGLVRPNGAPASSNGDPNEIVAYLSVFAALFSLALFVFEIRGILMCSDLIQTGRCLEEKLNITGQFCVCAEQRRREAYSTQWQRRLACHINAKLAASLIYSLVTASWLFVALNFGFRVPYPYCIMLATLSGLLLAISSYRIIWQLVNPTTTELVVASATEAPV